VGSRISEQFTDFHFDESPPEQLASSTASHFVQEDDDVGYADLTGE
jgi:hypothetical protein